MRQLHTYAANECALCLDQGEKELLLLRTFSLRHSGAGQPSVRCGKRMVAKGKTIEKC